MLLLGVALPAATTAQVDSTPPDVHAAAIERGRLLFEGPALCASCHGVDGTGVPRAGSDLTDSVWVHSDGSYEALVAQILAGVPAAHTESGARMPERGASRLSDRQLRAVAAYVWSLSRPERR